MEFNKRELNIISCILSERKSDMKSNLYNKDKELYIELCSIIGKINAMIDLIEYSERTITGEEIDTSKLTAITKETII